MSDWTWEYVPDTASVVGGLTSEQIAEVEALAARLADAVGVRRIGTPFDLQEAVSGLKTYGDVSSQLPSANADLGNCQLADRGCPLWSVRAHHMWPVRGPAPSS